MLLGVGGGDGVVAKDANLVSAPQFPDPLDEVVGEAVVVVDDENHAGMVLPAAQPVKPRPDRKNLQVIGQLCVYNRALGVGHL